MDIHHQGQLSLLQDMVHHHRISKAILLLILLNKILHQADNSNNLVNTVVLVHNQITNSHHLKLHLKMRTEVVNPEIILLLRRKHTQIMFHRKIIQLLLLLVLSLLSQDLNKALALNQIMVINQVPDLVQHNMVQLLHLHRSVLLLRVE